MFKGNSQQHTVLLTGAGGVAVPFLIESLQKRGFRVIGADMDPSAIGLYVADQGYVIPGGMSPDFLRVMKEICKKELVRAVVPLVDEELISAFELENDGVHVVLPKPAFISTCLDKFVLMTKLKDAGITVPETHLVSDGYSDIRFPAIVKPRRGRGSRGIQRVDSMEVLNSFLNASAYASEDLLVQEYIQGIEYTVSVVVWRDGGVQAVVPKEIISKKGITRMAVTRRNSKIEHVCSEVQNKFGADGPFNVQLCYDMQRDEPVIFEINPRFSTSTTLTMSAGIDEVAGLLSQAIIGDRSVHIKEWCEGVVMIRMSMDKFMDETEFCLRRENIIDWRK